MDDARLVVGECVINQRMTLADLLACLIFAVKLVYVFDELAVEKLKRNTLGTYSAALSAIGTTTCYVISADNMEHIFLEIICSRLVLYLGVGVIENALDTATSGAYVSASVTSDTLGKLCSPEFKAFVGSHSLKLCYHIKFIVSGGLRALSDLLIYAAVGLALAAETFVKKRVLASDLFISVKCGDLKHITVLGDCRDTLDAHSSELFNVDLSAASDTDGVDLASVYTVLGTKLVETVGITGLEQSYDLFILGHVRNKIFSYVAAAE